MEQGAQRSPRIKIPGQTEVSLSVVADAAPNANLHRAALATVTTKGVLTMTITVFSHDNNLIYNRALPYSESLGRLRV